MLKSLDPLSPQRLVVQRMAHIAGAGVGHALRNSLEDDTDFEACLLHMRLLIDFATSCRDDALIYRPVGSCVMLLKKSRNHVTIFGAKFCFFLFGNT